MRGESVCEAVSTPGVGPQCPLVSDGLFVVLSVVFTRLVGHGKSGNSLFLPPVSIGELELQTLLFLGVWVLKFKSLNLQVSTLSIETSLHAFIS